MLRLEDKDGQTPLDLLSRELKGASSSKLSQTLVLVKDLVKQARKTAPKPTGDQVDTKDEL